MPLYCLMKLLMLPNPASSAITAMLFDDYSAAGIDATVSYLKENYQNLYE